MRRDLEHGEDSLRKLNDKHEKHILRMATIEAEQEEYSKNLKLENENFRSKVERLNMSLEAIKEQNEERKGKVDKLKHELDESIRREREVTSAFKSDSEKAMRKCSTLRQELEMKESQLRQTREELLAKNRQTSFEPDNEISVNHLHSQIYSKDVEGITSQLETLGKKIEAISLAPQQYFQQQLPHPSILSYGQNSDQMLELIKDIKNLKENFEQTKNDLHSRISLVGQDLNKTSLHIPSREQELRKQMEDEKRFWENKYKETIDDIRSMNADRKEEMKCFQSNMEILCKTLISDRDLSQMEKEESSVQEGWNEVKRIFSSNMERLFAELTQKQDRVEAEFKEKEKEASEEISDLKQTLHSQTQEVNKLTVELVSTQTQLESSKDKLKDKQSGL